MDEPVPVLDKEYNTSKEFVIIQTNLAGPIKIKVPCQYRAKFYYKHLVTACDAFASQFSTKAFCDFAEVHTQLNTRLAAILDDQIMVALDKIFKTNPFLQTIGAYEARRDRYIKFCDDTSFLSLKNKNKGLFSTNKQVTKNFIKANLKMLERIERDFVLLSNHFLADLKNPKLTNIGSTGSDFHRGGQQVLILMFSDSTKQTKKIVYKPSPVQADALLVGDVERLKTINPIYQNHFSLLELMNRSLSDSTKLPLYLILPMNDASTQEVISLSSEKSFQEDISLETDSLPMNLNSHYGYLEYLSHEPWDLPDDIEIIKHCFNKNPEKADIEIEKEAQKIRNNYFSKLLSQATAQLPSDFITHKKEDIIRYSHDCGLLASMMVLSGVIDNHCQNLLISMLRPFLLDNEICLVHMAPNIRNQLCFDLDGSMNPLSTGRNEYKILMDVSGIKEIKIRHKEKNILFHHKGNKFIACAQNPNFFMQGFKKGIRIFQKSRELFAKWFTLPCVQIMMIRVPLYSTWVFSEQIRALKDEDFSFEKFSEIRMHRSKFDAKLANSVIYADDRLAKNLFDDFTTLNIPVFYTVSNQVQVYNAYGNSVMLFKGEKISNIHEKENFFKISSLDFTYHSAMKILDNPAELLASTEVACITASQPRKSKKPNNSSPQDKTTLHLGEQCRMT